MTDVPLSREIIFRPAWDKRDPDPSKDKGICGVSLSWRLRGPLGVISWHTLTQWYPPNVRLELERRNAVPTLEPIGGAVSYHTTIPHGQNESHECNFVDGDCYGDFISFIEGHTMAELLVNEGSEAVWDSMRRYYKAYIDQLARK